jgi:hypothetical protein
LDVHPTEIALPSGTLKQYDLSSDGVILIEEKPHEVVLSWTADISARSFLALCDSLVSEARCRPYGASAAIVSAGEARLDGDGYTVVQEALSFADASMLACDFIRLDLSTISVAYHDFGIGNGRIVSWVGTTLTGSGLTSLLKATASPFIEQRVWCVAQASAFACRPHEFHPVVADPFALGTTDTFIQSPPHNIQNWAPLMVNQRRAIQ